MSKIYKYLWIHQSCKKIQRVVNISSLEPSPCFFGLYIWLKWLRHSHQDKRTRKLFCNILVDPRHYSFWLHQLLSTIAYLWRFKLRGEKYVRFLSLFICKTIWKSWTIECFWGIIVKLFERILFLLIFILFLIPHKFYFRFCVFRL